MLVEVPQFSFPCEGDKAKMFGVLHMPDTSFGPGMSHSKKQETYQHTISNQTSPTHKHPKHLQTGQTSPNSDWPKNT